VRDVIGKDPVPRWRRKKKPSPKGVYGSAKRRYRSAVKTPANSRDLGREGETALKKPEKLKQRRGGRGDVRIKEVAELGVMGQKAGNRGGRNEVGNIQINSRNSQGESCSGEVGCSSKKKATEGGYQTANVFKGRRWRRPKVQRGGGEPPRHTMSRANQQ